MYEDYTRQSLPSREYREKLGSALCVFNSNFGFIVENILNSSPNDSDNWYDLINLPGSKLQKRMQHSALSKRNDIIELFASIVLKRNRIIHSFRITNKKGEQSLATLEKETLEQYEITEEILLEFIKDNEHLSDLLHEFRGF